MEKRGNLLPSKIEEEDLKLLNIDRSDLEDVKKYLNNAKEGNLFHVRRCYELIFFISLNGSSHIVS